MIDDTFNVKKLGSLLKNARRVQENLEKTQSEIGALQITGESGGGMVRIVVNGERLVRKVHIDSTLLTDGDMLQDLIAAAMNNAMQKAEAEINEKIQSSLNNELNAE
ncbi:YbaB/EbfC family nucleoid-associated protein [Candidatus Persebacteraceae bacterium Df01]|jgi:hypothetical protein|uniref:Nucleoid-associated protein NQX30_06745 n=1 Tax=Candidatus Doriopsillibacter californiensis TaxID=2970740 RepID=A0ABT7QMX3_9GAMM|nr:YbaB/EbfC family nucleoid-associated protein [Candidatus Persebacteraceae bacterium Df01]